MAPVHLPHRHDPAQPEPATAGTSSRPEPAAGALARRLWHVLEPIHAVVYFAPEAAEAYTRVGLKGYWMGYFASRAYPLGPASPELVTALFFGFPPAKVHRALPDAWKLASIDDIGAARFEVADRSLRRLWGDDAGGDDVAVAAELAGMAARGCEPAGRPMYAALTALAWPDAPHLQLWHAATMLREHRGDGHIVANVLEGVDGLEAHVMAAAAGNASRDVLGPARGWTDEQWAAAAGRLTDRGWLDGEELTEAGWVVRRRIEDRTDELASGPFEHLGHEATLRLEQLLTPLAQRILDAGAITIHQPPAAPTA